MQKTKADAKSRPLAAIMALATALALVSAPLPASAAGSGWSLLLGDSGSTDLLKQIITKAGFEQAQKGDIEFIGPDGPMPEISRQLVGISGDANTAIPTLTQACTGLGLGMPDADQSATEPNMICTGTFEGSRVTVHALLRCEPACELAIETRAIPN